MLYGSFTGATGKDPVMVKKSDGTTFDAPQDRKDAKLSDGDVEGLLALYPKKQ
jgi:hypothetical protein